MSKNVCDTERRQGGGPSPDALSAILWAPAHDGILRALPSSPAAIFLPDLADENASCRLPIVKLVQYPGVKAGVGFLASAVSGSSSG